MDYYFLLKMYVSYIRAVTWVYDTFKLFILIKKLYIAYKSFPKCSHDFISVCMLLSVLIILTCVRCQPHIQTQFHELQKSVKHKREECIDLLGTARLFFILLLAGVTRFTSIILGAIYVCMYISEKKTDPPQKKIVI